MTGGPWAFHLHPAAWAVVVALGALSVLAGRSAPRTRRQRWQLAVGLCTLALALTWPVADLAAHWSLTALLVQRLVLTLVCAPMLLLSVPRPVLGRLTRPGPIDAVIQFVTRPPVAVVTFSAIVVGTLVVPAVLAQADAPVLRATFDGLLLAAGVVLWMPVLGHVPGTRRTSPVAKAAYLIVQSVLPNFPSVVFIFARHPLYAAFAHAHQAIGLSPLGDQQLAGVVAKVGTLPVLWTAAYRALARAQRAEERGTDEEPLYWTDVERELERTARAERRLERHGPGTPTD